MKLVKLADYKIEGYNYHVVSASLFKITQKELHAIGITEAAAYVDEKLIEPLQKANQLLKQHSYKLLVKDGYRSTELYELAAKKRRAHHSAKQTKQLMNLKNMPHATGLAVDVGLISLKNGHEVTLRNFRDGLDAKFIGYYHNRRGRQSREYQRRQDLLHKVMKRAGFKLGVKNEIWHFELNLTSR